MPTEEQLNQSVESQFEFAETRRKDDPMLTQPSTHQESYIVSNLSRAPDMAAQIESLQKVNAKKQRRIDLAISDLRKEVEQRLKFQSVSAEQAERISELEKQLTKCLSLMERMEPSDKYDDALHTEYIKSANEILKQ